MVNFCVWGAEILGISKTRKTNKAEITFLEVKALHNLAHEQRAQVRDALREYRQVAARARSMDAAYRAQLGLARRAA